MDQIISKNGRILSRLRSIIITVYGIDSLSVKETVNEMIVKLNLSKNGKEQIAEFIKNSGDGNTVLNQLIAQGVTLSQKEKEFLYRTNIKPIPEID